jgi:hypothetical protein
LDTTTADHIEEKKEKDEAKAEVDPEEGERPETLVLYDDDPFDVPPMYSPDNVFDTSSRINETSLPSSSPSPSPSPTATRT